MDIKCVFYENIYVFISLDSILGYIGIVRVYLNLLMYINGLIAVNTRPKTYFFVIKNPKKWMRLVPKIIFK